MSLAIHLPDQSIKELPEGATGETLAASIGPRLAQAALAIKVDRALDGSFYSVGDRHAR